MCWMLWNAIYVVIALLDADEFYVYDVRTLRDLNNNLFFSKQLS